MNKSWNSFEKFSSVRNNFSAETFQKKGKHSNEWKVCILINRFMLFSEEAFFEENRKTSRWLFEEDKVDQKERD
jgi:hypothetical protein